MKYLKFSHHYPKLEHKIFPTIRRRDRYAVGSTILIKEPEHQFEAKILIKFHKRLFQIPTPLLCYDTNTETREEAIELINSFYRNPLSDLEHLTILFLEKLDQSSSRNLKE